MTFGEANLEEIRTRGCGKTLCGGEHCYDSDLGHEENAYDDDDDDDGDAGGDYDDDADGDDDDDDADDDGGDDGAGGDDGVCKKSLGRPS